MPNPSRRVPKYRHHKATGQAVVTLSGTDFYLGPHGSQVSIAEYDRLVAEWLTSGRRLPRRDEESGFTVNELLVAYWGHCERHYQKNGKPTSEQSCIKVALGPVRRLYGHTQAADFGPLSLKACRQQMIDAGWERVSINTHVGRIRRMFKWESENELVPVDVFQALGTVAGLRKGRSDAVETKPVRPVADHLVEAVRPFVSRQVWGMIELQRLTAMRPGEVVLMRTADFSMTGPVWIYTPESHKTEHHDRQREIYLGPQAQEILAPFLKTDLTAYVFSPQEAENERRAAQRESRKTPVQPSQQNRRKKAPRQKAGERYNVLSYRRAIVTGCEQAFGMPKELRRIPKQLPKAERGRFSAAEWEAERERRQELASEWRAENCWHPNQVRLMSKQSQVGIAKIGIVAYDAKSRRMIGDGGVTLARSEDKNWYVLGVGPYRNGSIREEMKSGLQTPPAANEPLPYNVAFDDPPPGESQEAGTSRVQWAGSTEEEQIQPPPPVQPASDALFPEASH